jgi:hypothetical protein
MEEHNAGISFCEHSVELFHNFWSQKAELLFCGSRTCWKTWLTKEKSEKSSVWYSRCRYRR